MMYNVAPRVGAWIETLDQAMIFTAIYIVAPRVGAWIETQPQTASTQTVPESHLVWVRGLKHQFIYKLNGWIKVAPRVGAWIETLQLNLLLQLRNVAPRVGAWIETANKLKNGSPIFGSHLVWVRGLKLSWSNLSRYTLCRTSCGCVD